MFVTFLECSKKFYASANKLIRWRGAKPVVPAKQPQHQDDPAVTLVSILVNVQSPILSVVLNR